MNEQPVPSPVTGSGTPRPRVGIVGAGRVGTTLGMALTRAGWPVVAITSRDPGRRADFLDLVPTARAMPDPAQLARVVDLVLLTVPDDVIAAVAATLSVRAGQGVVHTSGALPASILSVSRVPGSAIASFHPLVPFADSIRALDALPGAAFAIEGDAPLVALLETLARDLGAHPVVLDGAGKAAYHAAAVLAAGGFVALLSVIAQLGHAAGLDEGASLATYGPLIRQAMANAEALGIGAALTGPYVRGDRRTVALHLDAIERLAPEARDLYVAAAQRQIELAVDGGALSPDRATELRRSLGGRAQPGAPTSGENPGFES